MSTKSLKLLNVPIAKGVRTALENCKEVGVEYVVFYPEMMTPSQFEEQVQLATQQGKMIIIERDF